jgi:hypothetical protein
LLKLVCTAAIVGSAWSPGPTESLQKIKKTDPAVMVLLLIKDTHTFAIVTPNIVNAAATSFFALAAASVDTNVQLIQVPRLP